MLDMKTVVMKLMCFGVVLAGIVVLGWSAQCSYIRNQVKAFRAAPPVTQMALAGAGGVTASVLALYGLLPSFSRRRRITRRNEHGETVIELNPMEAMLTRVIANMPMVKRVRIQLVPTKDKQKVSVRANAVLRYQPGKAAQATHDLINRYLKETATTTLGLEVMEPIQLNVTGVDADPKATSQALREQFAWTDLPADMRIQVPEEEKQAEQPVSEAKDAVSDLAAAPRTEATTAAPLESLEETSPVLSSRSDFDVAPKKDEPAFDTLAEPLDKQTNKDDEDNNRWSLQP
jgi:hypothetical protein